MEPTPESQVTTTSVTTEITTKPPTSGFIKFIRIFLLILIIIGIGLLCTINLWVPKLVNAILGKATVSAPTSATGITTPAASSSVGISTNSNVQSSGSSTLARTPEIVTVDPESYAKAGNVTITGTASNLTKLKIDVRKVVPGGVAQPAGGGTVAVLNGRWSFTLPLGPDEYGIQITNEEGNVLWDSGHGSPLLVQ